MLSGIVGTGSSMLLMPVLVALFGPRQAVPIMAIASIMGNPGKVLAWRRDIDWRGVWCLLRDGGAGRGARRPDAARVAALMRVELALGMFFIAMVPTRR